MNLSYYLKVVNPITEDRKTNGLDEIDKVKYKQ